MVMLESGNAARLRKRLRRAAQETKANNDFMDAYACWTVNRSSGWADGNGVEAQSILETGFGKIYANGAGGPQGGDMVVHLESPYRFRTHTTANIESGNLLVINGDRLFRVDVGKPEDAEDHLMDVYLTEMFSTPMPEVP